MRSLGLRLGAAVLLPTIPAAALANETITYRYDGRGRLIRVERSGTVNNNVNANYSHDPADNRTSHATGTGLAPVPPPPDPPPEPPEEPPEDPPENPPGPNQPPVAQPDSLSLPRCETASVNVTANDSDPDGDLPLTVLWVSPGTMGSAEPNGAFVNYSAGMQAGGETLTYAVQDSRGETDTSTIAVTIQSSENCGLGG